MHVKDTGLDFEQPPLGLQAAVCVAVHDLKYQDAGQYGMKHKVLIMFELEAKKTKGEYKDKRFLLSNRYTASIHERAQLGQHLTSWRGRPFTDEERRDFDLDKIIGKSCTLTLVQSKNGKYVNIDSIARPMEGHNGMTPEIEIGYMPDWVKDLIAKGIEGPEEEADSNISSVEDEFQDDIPF